LRTSCSYSK